MLRNGRQMGALCKIQTDRKIKNCLYFIRLKQKTRLSENRTKSMHFDKVGARINQQNQKSWYFIRPEKKNIPKKVCTLTLLGLHAFATKGFRQNCCSRCNPAHSRAASSRGGRLSPKGFPSGFLKDFIGYEQKMKSMENHGFYRFFKLAPSPAASLHSFRGKAWIVSIGEKDLYVIVVPAASSRGGGLILEMLSWKLPQRPGQLKPNHPGSYYP